MWLFYDLIQLKYALKNCTVFSSINCQNIVAGVERQPTYSNVRVFRSIATYDCRSTPRGVIIARGFVIWTFHGVTHSDLQDRIKKRFIVFRFLHLGVLFLNISNQAIAIVYGDNIKT